MRPPVNLSILDVTETAAGVRVTWQDDDVDAPLIHSADLELEWQAAEPDVGIAAGYCVYGDAPDWVLDHVAQWAIAGDCDAADDASELRAELRAEAGW